MIKRDTPSSQPTLGAGSRRTSARTFFLMALCCLFLVFGVYSSSLNFQFVLDDHNFTADPRIQDSGHIWDYFANYVWSQFTGGPPSFYRPVFLLWMRTNFVLSALSPWGWHLLSVVKHVLVATLLAMLIWELLRDRVAALVAGILFALHPAQTESVSWVTVPDPLMAAGLLGALLLYLKYVDFRSARPEPEQKKSRKRPLSQAPKRSVLWLFGSVVAYFAALLSKETAIVFPVLIGAVAVCMPLVQTAKNPTRTVSANRGERLAKALRDDAPFVGITALYLWLRFNALGGKLGCATQHLSWHTIILSSPSILWFYVKAMVWPVKSYSYADPTLIESFSVRGVLLPLFALATSVAVAVVLSHWVWRKAQRELAPQDVLGVKVVMIIGCLLLVLPLLPALDVNALNPGDFLHGRYTYLPLAGLALLLAAWYCSLKYFRVVWTCIAISLTITFAALTFAQQEQWKDDSTVFTIAHKLAPHNVPVAQKLANTHVQEALKLEEEGRCSKAIPVFNRVIEEYPEDWFAWGGLGVCYAQLNDLPKAEESLHRAANLSHNARVIQEWQQLRAQMGLPIVAP